MVGIDIGGTFTDFVVWREGRLATYKVPSTPQDFSQAVLAGLSALALEGETVVHGSTVATNALLERKGAKTALLTTAGFRDVLEIGRQNRPALYDLFVERPPPLVPRCWRREVQERISAQGEVLVPLKGAEVEPILREWAEQGVEAVAICLLFSFLYPAHEQALARRARRHGFYVSASVEVLPEFREYERTSTTVINAYLGPVVSRYLARLKEGLETRGCGLRIMQSNGGAISPRVAQDRPVQTVLSGPAAGVIGAFEVGRQAGFEHIITFDMGGTSTDVSLCPGQPQITAETELDGLPLRVPVLDIHTVGAGGGSVAWQDAGGALRVGPESAGADPGPACYGRG
ncbi:MAG TPA: hydantoinase/oxoprolinase family protein, partial [Armatimonadetes bacterium]|nr:hydantoinase/oxoprolinase family protein [Armatimonadota bacterium]